MKYIQTNIGLIPLEDYLDIKAKEYGFENYKELQAAGYKITINSVDIKEIK